MSHQQKLIPNIINKEIKKILLKQLKSFSQIGSSRFLVTSIFSIAEFELMKLVDAVKSLSPYRRNYVARELSFLK